jgi:hypothetical protein
MCASHAIVASLLWRAFQCAADPQIRTACWTGRAADWETLHGYRHGQPELTSAVIFTVGFQVLGTTVVFGLLTHLVGVAIAFILFIIGASSLTALTNGIDCGVAGQGFDRCNIVKGLVIISWIDT